MEERDVGGAWRRWGVLGGEVSFNERHPAKININRKRHLSTHLQGVRRVVEPDLPEVLQRREEDDSIGEEAEEEEEGEVGGGHKRERCLKNKHKHRVNCVLKQRRKTAFKAPGCCFVCLHISVSHRSSSLVPPLCAVHYLERKEVTSLCLQPGDDNKHGCF